jgi:hypothetical protein
MTLAANAQDRPEAMPGALSEPAGIRQAPRPELSAAIVGPDGLAAMAELALLVSGLEPSRVPAYRDRLLTMAESARDQVAASSQASGEALLVYLHGSAGPFRRYLAKQTRIDVLLDSGTFNCVSSAVVYWLAAGAAGLDVGAVGTRDHAFCTVRANGREVDVETTIAYGYDPGRRQDFRDAFGKVTGMVWVPAGNYTTRQALDFRHLLGLVLQNLAADAQERRDDLSPVGLAWDSAALVGLEAARPLLSTAYHNRAAGLNASGDYPGAMAVVLAAESRLGPSPDRAVLVRGIASNLLVVAMSQRNWPEAHALLSRWRDRLGPLVRQSAVNLFRLESQDVFRSAGWEGFAVWMGSGPAEPEVEQPEWSAAWEMGITGELARLTRAGDWEAGLRFLEKLPAGLDKLPGVVRAREAVNHNIVAGYHNRFAALANAGKLDAAREILVEAMARFPEDRILLQDKAALERR